MRFFLELRLFLNDRHLELLVREGEENRRIWNARFGEQLQTTQEDGNSEDRFAVALTKDDRGMCPGNNQGFFGIFFHMVKD